MLGRSTGQSREPETADAVAFKRAREEDVARNGRRAQQQQLGGVRRDVTIEQRGVEGVI